MQLEGKRRDESGMRVWLRMPYEVRVATRLDPESWLSASDCRWQALTGVGIGQASSSERLRQWGADGFPNHGRQHGPLRQWQVAVRPHGVRDPGHVPVYLMRGTREVPAVPVGVVAGGSAREGEEPNGGCARCWEVGQTHKSEEADEPRSATG